MKKPHKTNGGRPRGRDEATVLRMVKALDLRIQGYTWRQIGEQIGRSHERARKLVHKLLRETIDASQEKADEFREIENMRLDKMLLVFLTKALEEKDEKAALRVIQISRRRSEINGFDMPAKMAATDPSGEMVQSILHLKGEEALNYLMFGKSAIRNKRVEPDRDTEEEDD